MICAKEAKEKSQSFSKEIALAWISKFEKEIDDRILQACRKGEESFSFDLIRPFSAKVKQEIASFYHKFGYDVTFIRSNNSLLFSWKEKK